MKTTGRIILSLLAIIAGVGSQVRAAGLASQFKHPGPEFRPVPFFSLNDDLKQDELTWQIKEMRSHGFGGSFLHARVGRITPYMSDEWLACIGKCVKESKSSGIYAWLYDEDRWPSGFAGGIVPEKGKEYRQKTLDLKEWDFKGDLKVETADGKTTINGHTNVIAWFSCRKEGMGFADVKRLPLSADASIPKGAHILLFRVEIRSGDPWFNGFSYVDTLNPKIIQAFIDSTYEPYFKKFGASFGKEVPGIFTDEPNISPTAWTEALPEKYRARYGYDLLDYLPALYYPVSDWQRIRYEYRKLTADMFVEAYSKQLYEWCDKHKIQFTGHYLAEDNLTSQLKEAGSCMPHYEYEHMPGIDHLFRKLGEVSLMKQVSSAANQLGRKRVLSETYGGGGWNMSFGDMRWIANWQLALGVNFMNPHLCHYSLRGNRKRDWPPSSYYQQPYWKYYDRVNDYTARACLMLTQGQFVADTLVLHPISSAWSVYSPKDESEANALSDRFRRLSAGLVETHREFEYGDETLMAKYAKVDGKELVVGQMRYKVLLIPSVSTVFASTFALVKQFLDAGGSVVAIKPTPTRVEGVESKEIGALFETPRPNLALTSDIRDDVAKALDAAVPRGVSVVDVLGMEQPRVAVHRRRDGKKEIIFLANTNRDETYKVTVKTAAGGRVEQWNLETGASYAVPTMTDSTGTSVDLRIPGGGSALLVIDSSAKSVKLPANNPTRAHNVNLNEAWRVKRHGPNSLVMDTCSYKIGDGEWKGPLPVYRVQQEMEGQPDGMKVALKFEFDLDFDPAGGLFQLVLEQPEIYTITLNGAEIKFKDAGWWVDKSFRKFDISKGVKSGVNTLEMSCAFVRPTKPRTLEYVKNGVEFESVYLLGEFAVDATASDANGPENTTVFTGPFKLNTESPVPIIGDLTAAGYPFFAGDIELYQDVDVPFMPEGRIYLEFEGLNAEVAKVYVNGKDAGTVCWPPYRTEVTSVVEKGSNRVQVLLSNSLRNLLGPLHHKKGELTVASPSSFVDGSNWTETYQAVKLGILGTARFAWEE